jgi:holo-[acyl-carrier protein] synthase
MKLATGVDLIEIERIEGVIERHGEHFLRRVFTQRELVECADQSASLAGRFAAKEATAKALGTGIGQVGWLDIEVCSGPENAPQLCLSGAALRRSTELHLSTWSVSISHTRIHAVALVVACGED